jgi:D-xylose transport system ATP-binding protein
VADNILELKKITKKFTGVVALKDVSLEVKHGEIHALCGENGAGKSTLIKILSGIYSHETYSGEFYLDGELQKYTTIRDADDNGIDVVQQELALVDGLSIQENIFLRKSPAKLGIINWEEMYLRTKELLTTLGMGEYDPTTKLSKLGVGQKQLVEIARILEKKPRILLLDEPTSSLTEKEVNLLLDIVDNLRKNGVTCIYISHKLEEVFRISDTITVLRDGEKIITTPANQISKSQLITHMVGRPLDKQFPRVEHEPKDTVMEISHVTVFDNTDPTVKRVDDVSFKIRKGEILGVCGLIGAGRTELFSSIFGIYSGRFTGDVKIEGKDVSRFDPKIMISRGFCMLPEDRKQHGLVLSMGVKENISLAALKQISRIVIDYAKEISVTQKHIENLKIKTPSIETKVNNLSGGNQQKVVIAKWLQAQPLILVLDEPTRGIDIGAKFEIYNIMNELVDKGIAIVMISSELEEILGMSDRILVMNGGKIKGDFAYLEASQEKIMHSALSN